MRTIYLDHQATTPVDPRVLDAMLPWFSRPANPHADHVAGREAARAVERARQQIAELVGADADEIVLTSGATEAANTALRSLAPGSRVLVCAIEHHCVLATLDALRDRIDVEIVPVGADGVLDPDQVAEMVEGRDAVVAMAVNNEIGTVQPLEQIGALCRMTAARLMTDVTQAAGRVPVDLAGWNATAAWLSSHKIYGPQGVGAMVWRGERPPAALLTGGGQERGLRSGTVPTALVVGFGMACEVALREMEHDCAHAADLSAAFLAAVRAHAPDVVVNGSERERVPHNLNLAVPGIDADELVARVPELAISTGSACSAGAFGNSHVLEAVAGSALAASSIRIGFGRDTTREDVVEAARSIGGAIEALRAMRLMRTGTA